MTDEEYLFRQDVKEKAITARSSHKRGNSRRRQCSFSTDHMTRREWEKMNGPVSTVKLGQPMTWEEFSGMSESLRRQYIQDILNHYDVGPNAIGRMLGVSGPYCGKRLRELGFKFETRASAKETARFLADFGLAGADEPGFDRVSVTFAGQFSPELLVKKLAALFELGREAVVTIEIAAK